MPRYQELKHPAMTIQLHWQEYTAGDPAAGLQYSQLCVHFLQPECPSRHPPPDVVEEQR